MGVFVTLVTSRKPKATELLNSRTEAQPQRLATQQMQPAHLPKLMVQVLRIPLPHVPLLRIPPPHAPLLRVPLPRNLSCAAPSHPGRSRQRQRVPSLVSQRPSNEPIPVSKPLVLPLLVLLVESRKSLPIPRVSCNQRLTKLVSSTILYVLPLSLSLALSPCFQCKIIIYYHTYDTNISLSLSGVTCNFTFS